MWVSPCSFQNQLQELQNTTIAEQCPDTDERGITKAIQTPWKTVRDETTRLEKEIPEELVREGDIIAKEVNQTVVWIEHDRDLLLVVKIVQTIGIGTTDAKMTSMPESLLRNYNNCSNTTMNCPNIYTCRMNIILRCLKESQDLNKASIKCTRNCLAGLEDCTTISSRILGCCTKISR